MNESCQVVVEPAVHRDATVIAHLLERTRGMFLQSLRSDGQRVWRVFEFSSPIQGVPD